MILGERTLNNALLRLVPHPVPETLPIADDVDGDDTQKKDNRKHAQASNFFWR